MSELSAKRSELGQPPKFSARIDQAQVCESAQQLRTSVLVVTSFAHGTWTLTEQFGVSMVSASTPASLPTTYGNSANCTRPFASVLCLLGFSRRVTFTAKSVLDTNPLADQGQFSPPAQTTRRITANSELLHNEWNGWRVQGQATSRTSLLGSL